ncbi:MAG: hypothetical protein NDI93_00505 [Pseudomonas sp.]|nr:hypothetical protein [Pseudomonas sp.]
MATIDSQAAALMTLANDALAEASNVANRIVRTDPNFSVSFSYSVADPGFSKPGSTDSLVSDLGGVSYTPTLPVLSAPSDPQALIESGTDFSHSVSVAAIEQPGDPSALLGSNLRFDHTVAGPVMTKPNAPAVSFDGEENSAMLAWLDGEAEQWFTRFFPELAAANANKDKPEQWLWGIITGSDPFGMAPSAFTAIWNQARDREYRARNSAVDQIRQEFSARGFTLPPGAMVGAIARAEEAATDAIAGVNLAQMIRESEIKVDLLKFAEEQALRLKSGVMQSLADFYRQWISLPDKSHEKGRLQLASYESLNRALNDFYQLEMRLEELRMKAAELRATGGIEESKLRVSAYSAMNDALNAFRAGEINLEDLKIKAENLRSSGVMEKSRLKVSTYSALQGAMSEYHRIVRDFEALKADMAKVGVDSNIEISRLKVSAYSAMQSALASYNAGELSLQELKMSAKKIEADVKLDVLKSEAAVRSQTYSSWNQGYAQAARAFGDVAAQAASAAGTLNAQISSV